MFRLSRTRLLLVALAGPALAAGCGRASADDAKVRDATPNQVVIDNFSFSPKVLNVSRGTTVTWVNRDDVPHTVTSSTKPRAFASDALDTDGRFSQVFTAPGTYSYFCAIHPHMTGTIVVK